MRATSRCDAGAAERTSSWKASTPAWRTSSRSPSVSAARGLPVRVHIEGNPVPLPRALDLSAYRRVGEEHRRKRWTTRTAEHADVVIRYGANLLWLRDPRRRPRASMAGAGPGARARRHPRARQALRQREVTAGAANGAGLPTLASLGRLDDAAMSIGVLRGRRPVDGGGRLSHALKGEPDIDVVAGAKAGQEAVEEGSALRARGRSSWTWQVPAFDGLQAGPARSAGDRRQENPGAHDLRSGRVHLRGAEGGCERLRPQGRPA